MKRVSLIYFFTLLLSIISVNAFAEANSNENQRNIFEEQSTITDDEMQYYLMNEILTYASADVNIINISTDIGTMNVRNEETEEEPFVANATMETVDGNRMIVPVSEEVAIKEELEEEPPIQRTFFIKAPNTGRK